MPAILPFICRLPETSTMCWIRQRFVRIALVIILFMAAGSTAQAGIVLNQIDTFQDGTLANWTNGAGAADPINIATGGPTGAGDHYLQVTSNGGNFAGSKLTVFNTVQWSGNYTAAGVTFVEMDFKNF